MPCLAGCLVKILNQLDKTMAFPKIAHKSVFRSISQFFKYQPEKLNKAREQNRRLRQIEQGKLKPF